MSPYVILLVIIVALAVINFATLFWVSSLQRKLRTTPQVQSSALVPATADPAVDKEIEDSMVVAAAAAKKQLDAAVAQAAKTLAQDLSATSLKVNRDLQELAEKYIRQELEEYHKTVIQFKDTASASLTDIQQTMDQQRQSLTKGLNEEIAAERERLLAQFDRRLADVVSAYLIEALGNNADLGTQSQSLFAALEQHKAELKKDIASGIPTA
jgi:hypothetical protein